MSSLKCILPSGNLHILMRTTMKVMLLRELTIIMWSKGLVQRSGAILRIGGASQAKDSHVPLRALLIDLCLIEIPVLPYNVPRLVVPTFTQASSNLLQNESTSQPTAPIPLFIAFLKTQKRPKSKATELHNANEVQHTK